MISEVKAILTARLIELKLELAILENKYRSPYNIDRIGLLQRLIPKMEEQLREE